VSPIRSTQADDCLGGLAGKGVSARARDQRLPRRSQAIGQDAPPVRIELRENVVQEQQRPRASALLQKLGLAEQESENREALLALRAERAQVALAREDPDVVEVRAQARRPALEVARGAGLQLVHRRRFGLVGERPAC